jgi:hypothetical protein
MVKLKITAVTNFKVHALVPRQDIYWHVQVDIVEDYRDAVMHLKNFHH